MSMGRPPTSPSLRPLSVGKRVRSGESTYLRTSSYSAVNPVVDDDKKRSDAANADTVT